MDATSRDVRESLPGWAWVALGGALVVLLPLWLIFTAAVLQLTPEPWIAERPWFVVWILGGVQGGLALLVLLGIVAVMTAVGAVIGRLAAARQRRARISLDAAVDPDAVLPELTLRTRTIETYDPRR